MREDTTVVYARTIIVTAPETVRIKAYKPSDEENEWHIRIEAAAPRREDAESYVGRVLEWIVEELA
jgi:hypothetical protein